MMTDKRCGNCEWFDQHELGLSGNGNCMDQSKFIRRAGEKYIAKCTTVHLNWVCDNHKPKDFTKWAELNTPRDVA